jgi:hypothetical protein
MFDESGHPVFRPILGAIVKQGDLMNLWKFFAQNTAQYILVKINA